MAVTSSTPKESSPGLMMTPPPIPQIAPTIDAPKHTTKNISHFSFLLSNPSAILLSKITAKIDKINSETKPA